MGLFCSNILTGNLFVSFAFILHVFIYTLKSLPQADDKDDDDWGDDFTEEAIKARMEELSDAAKGLAFTDDLEKPAEDRLNMVYEMLKVRPMFVLYAVDFQF